MVITAAKYTQFTNCCYLTLWDTRYNNSFSLLIILILTIRIFGYVVVNPYEEIIHRNDAYRRYGAWPCLLGDDHIPGRKHLCHVQRIDKFRYFF